MCVCVCVCFESFQQHIIGFRYNIPSGFSFETINWCILTPGGGGGTLKFSAYVGSDQGSTVHPKKIIEILATPKNTPILYL